MRVNAAFNRLLGFPGTVVEKVVFTATQILVSVRLGELRLRCPCGQVSPATYDRSQRSWRHLDPRHTRDFEDTAAWLVRRMSKASDGGRF